MIEEYLSSSNNIINDAKTLENLLKESHSLEVRNVQLTDELEDLKQKISEASEKKEELSDRSQAIKDKFHDFDEVTKHENERHASEIKNFFKNILGMKVHLDFLEDDENSVKLTLNFREKEDYPITLSYDFSSGNYKCKLNYKETFKIFH